MSSTTSGTFQGRAAKPRSLMVLRLPRGSPTASGSGNASAPLDDGGRRHCTELPHRFPHIGSKPSSAQRRLGAVVDVAGERRFQAPRRRPRSAPPHRPARGHRTPRRRGASALAPRGRPPPFRGNCRRCRGRNGRTAAAPTACRFGGGAQPPQHQHEMQHDHVEPRRHRVGHPDNPGRILGDRACATIVP